MKTAWPLSAASKGAASPTTSFSQRPRNLPPRGQLGGKRSRLWQFICRKCNKQRGIVLHKVHLMGQEKDIARIGTIYTFHGLWLGWSNMFKNGHPLIPGHTVAKAKVTMKKTRANKSSRLQLCWKLWGVVVCTLGCHDYNGGTAPWPSHGDGAGSHGDRHRCAGHHCHLKTHEY